MRILVDTNVLTRVAQESHPHSPIATLALNRLWDEGHTLRIVPQVLYEFWVVATRSRELNGLGMAVEAAAQDVERFKSVFSALRDERGILEPWQQMVLALQVQGKQGHDAHLVAAMQRHSLSHILTFNVADFARYPGISVIDPRSIVQGTTS